MASRIPYRESRRKLVIAFDVGTTFSGVSYSVLDPGQIPEIKGVTRFPAQEHVTGSSKIPTIIYYDPRGSVRAVGAEAIKDGVLELATDNGWVKAEWFKLHLRPRTRSTEHIAAEIPPLPSGKTVVQVFADYLRYLFQCTSSYIRDTHANGHTLWASVENHIDYVLSHPNGWEGPQQNQMREASVLAGLIPSTPEGHARISFVTEGEASLHFSINNGFSSTTMNNGDGVLIVDAGGGTIDISAYARRGSSFAEIAAPQCYFHGSIFVTIEVRKLLSGLLSDSPFIDDLDHIIRCFDKTTKHRFRDVEETQFIKFGSIRDNDEEFNIRYGQLKLTGRDVASCFEPSVKCVVDTVIEQHRVARQRFSHVILVGGFAASDYLHNRLRAMLEPSGFLVIRPENHVSKAVAGGAISFYLDHFVRTRVAKVTYGAFANALYNPHNPEHREREADTFVSMAGEKRVQGSFTVILPKNTQVSETQEFRSSFTQLYKLKTDFASLTSTVWCYRGVIAEPRWRDTDTRMYSKVCTIELDLSHFSRNTKEIKRHGAQGKFYRLDYDIVLLFGLTELKAQLAWMEKGVEKKSPAKIVYDPDSTRED